MFIFHFVFNSEFLASSGFLDCLIIFITLFLSTFSRAEDLFIEAKDITLNKDKQTTIFKNNVHVKTNDKKISSEFAEFDKEAQTIILRENIKIPPNTIISAGKRIMGWPLK